MDGASGFRSGSGRGCAWFSRGVGAVGVRGSLEQPLSDYKKPCAIRRSLCCRRCFRVFEVFELVFFFACFFTVNDVHW